MIKVDGLVDLKQTKEEKEKEKITWETQTLEEIINLEAGL